LKLESWLLASASQKVSLVCFFSFLSADVEENGRETAISLIEEVYGNI